MTLTRNFRETVLARAKRDARFRRGLLQDGIALLLTGDPEDAAVGRGMIRDYINATCGFDALSRATKTPAKSLMRMFGASGNPSLKNFSAVVGELQRHEGIRLQVQGERRTA